MFQGADTDQLRAASTVLREAGSTLESTLRRIASEVTELSWQGPDADVFRRRAGALVLGAQVVVVATLRAHGDDLRRHADAQDATSATLTGAGVEARGAPPTNGRNQTFDLSRLSLTAGGANANTGIDRFLDGAGGSHGAGLAYDWTWAGPSGDVAAWRSGRQGSGRLGEVALAGSATVALLAARAGTSAGLHAGLDGVNAEASAHAGAYYFDAKAQGSATYGVATLAGSARVMEGAEASASANVGIGKDGLRAKAEAGGVAGVQATADASIDVAGVGAGGHATGIVGVAAKASAEASVSLTQVKAHVEVAAALGIGGGVSLDVNVQPKKIVQEITSWHLF